MMTAFWKCFLLSLLLFIVAAAVAETEGDALVGTPEEGNFCITLYVFSAQLYKMNCVFHSSTVFVLLLSVVQQPHRRQRRQPSFVLFTVPDLSFEDWSRFFSNPIMTPTFHHLVEKEGIMLDSFYSTSTCSPSRVALLTGQRVVGETPPTAMMTKFAIPSSSPSNVVRVCINHLFGRRTSHFSN
jgi:hypothetical protein